MHPLRSIGFLATSVALILGICVLKNRNGIIRHYEVPHEPPPSAHPSMELPSDHPPLDHPTTDLPPPPTTALPFAWTVPDDWEAQPPRSSMTAAMFRVPGNGDPDAELTVTALGGMAGDALSNVNRWRGQLGLAPITETDLPALTHPIDIKGLDSAQAIWVTLLSETPLDGNPYRSAFAVAFFEYDGSVWFFKLAGPEATVTSAQASLRALVETLKPASAESHE